MNEQNRQLLDDEIRSEFELLDSMELGSESYKIAVDGLTKLIDRSIELKKLEHDAAEAELKSKQLRIDNSFKSSQILNEKADRAFTNGIAIAGIVIPSIITIWGTFKTLRFEEHGTVTTIMGRGFINKLLPKK